MSGFMWINGYSQELSSLKKTYFYAQSDTLQLDTLIIEATSFKLYYADSVSIDGSQYFLNPVTGKFFWKENLPEKQLMAVYRVLNTDVHKAFKNRSTDLIQPEDEYNVLPYTYLPTPGQESIFGSTKLNKTGSISRGIGLGNNQDLTVNSTLSLQLNGHLTDNIRILASVTDNNIPIQPEGNTAQLQEFDQVYIQLYDDNSKLLMGDFVLESPTGYFTRYFKKAQGASFTTTLPIRDSQNLEFYTQTSAAVSKGKFARNIIAGEEGNQGPYRLRGNNGETFIIVLSGTEKVYINGIEMSRGQENDYIIDYNTAEIIFTPNQFIDKDKRITVEFQYSDANYVKTMVQTSTGLKSDKWNAYINFYNEQDAKNQPLQQDLNDDDKRILYEIGNQLDRAVAPSLTPVDQFNNDQVLYQLIDSLGYDSVFVRAYGDAPNLHTVYFSEVGENRGDYAQTGFDATGRVFEWIAPDTVAGQIIKQGNYAPVRLLIPPQKSQMLMARGSYTFSEKTDATIELGISNRNLNTFSPLDNEANISHGLVAELNHKQSLSKKEDAARVVGKFNMEIIGNNFQPIEPYRSIEFNRDWNIDSRFDRNRQELYSAMVGLEKPKKYNVKYNLQHFNSRKDYNGLKNEIHAAAHLKGFDAEFTGSLLQSSGYENSTFARHNSKIEKRMWITKLGFQDEREENLHYIENTDSLTANAYKFYDWQLYLTQLDSAKINYKVYYSERSDYFSEYTQLEQTTYARQYGLDLDFSQNPSHQFQVKLANRELEVLNPELSSQEPENTLLGRLEHNLKLAKNAIIAHTYYEIGSGLERRQEFLYLLDPTGKGPYTWIDYNENGIKELNEFELARPEDGERYIRVFTPTDTYERAYSNQFSHALNINPVSLWFQKEGILKILSKFSNQTAFKIQRKTRMEDKAERFNPFVTQFGDTALISQSANIRNTFFFNRTGSKAGADYTFSKQSGKSPLTNGFEERKNIAHILRLRYNFNPQFGLILDQEIGSKESASDILEGRNFTIEYFDLKQTLTYQPSTAFRLSFSNAYSQKNNVALANDEEAEVIDLGLDFRLSKAESGTFYGQTHVISIKYTGMANTSLAYQMLDGLQNGTNVTWSAGIQRTLGKNLQLSLSYNGRKSEDIKAIHTGNMQVRAFF